MEWAGSPWQQGRGDWESSPRPSPWQPSKTSTKLEGIICISKGRPKPLTDLQIMSSSSTAVKGWTQLCARELSSLSWIFQLPVPNVLSKLTLKRHPSFLTCAALTTDLSSAIPFHVCNLIYWDLKINRRTVDSLTSTHRASPRDYPQWMPTPANHQSYDA